VFKLHVRSGFRIKVTPSTTPLFVLTNPRVLNDSHNNSHVFRDQIHYSQIESKEQLKRVRIPNIKIRLVVHYYEIFRSSFINSELSFVIN